MGASFSRLKAFAKLQKLAEKPFDLTQKGALTQQRLHQMQVRQAPFLYLYSQQRVTNEVVDALIELAQESRAIQKMQAMQEGEIINRIEGHASENRAVLHTAMRDFFDGPQSAPAAAAAAKCAKIEVDKLKEFCQHMEKAGFTDIVQIGIGGSDLGPRAVYLALQAYKKKGRRAHFISNVDPDDLAALFQDLPLEKTLVVVVSKSGTTLETCTNEAFARAYFEKKGIDPKKHFLAVTGQNSPMDNPQRYLQSFYIWDYVGGRYSASSMVGGVVLAFALGWDVYMDFLYGAHCMDVAALKHPLKENLPLMAALMGIWNRNFLHLPTVAVLPYSQALSRFTAHLQQCDMESNGKHIDQKGHLCDFATGPIVWGEPGTNGQHSFYQWIHQGTDIAALEFIGFKESQYGKDFEVKETSSQQKLIANLLAQSLALAMGQKSDNPNKVFLGNRPNSLLLAKKLDPFTMGSLLSFYEHKVAFQGFIWNINSYDQEGVQLGKVLATQILQIMKGDKKAKEEFALGAHLLSLLEKE